MAKMDMIDAYKLAVLLKYYLIPIIESLKDLQH